MAHLVSVPQHFLRFLVNVRYSYCKDFSLWTIVLNDPICTLLIQFSILKDHFNIRNVWLFEYINQEIH